MFLLLQVAKHFAGSNLKFAICNEDEFADEIKSLGFEDTGEDVSVGCFTEKQKFRMKPTEEFEMEDLVSLQRTGQPGQKGWPEQEGQPGQEGLPGQQGQSRP